MERTDPVGPEYYVPLGKAERASDFTFYASGALSILLLLVDKGSYPRLYTAIEAVFVVAVIVVFCLGIIIKLYFSARARAGRSADFMSTVFSVPLVPYPSQGYYHPPSGDPFLRIGSSILENALFTKGILRSMLVFERSRVCVYLLIWLLAVAYRSTNPEVLAVAAQVVFSEQLVSRWVRMEWLRTRSERIHGDLYALFQLGPERRSKEFQARVMDALVGYETSKAQAGISLSTRVFNRLNDGLSSEWDTTSRQLRIVPAEPPSV